MSDVTIAAPQPSAQQAAFGIILAVSFCHLLNDVMQSLLTATYPLLKANYGLDFGQIGLLTFTFQVTASLLQPLVGLIPTSTPCPIRCRSAWARRWSG
jgi:FSR family fosmidomycin resistance protein-like MFS transporter